MRIHESVVLINCTPLLLLLPPFTGPSMGIVTLTRPTMAERGAWLLQSLFTRTFRLSIRLRAFGAVSGLPLCKFSALAKLKHPFKRGFSHSELHLDELVLQEAAMLLLLHTGYVQLRLSWSAHRLHFTYETSTGSKEQIALLTRSLPAMSQLSRPNMRSMGSRGRMRSKAWQGLFHLSPVCRRYSERRLRHSCKQKKLKIYQVPEVCARHATCRKILRCYFVHCTEGLEDGAT